MGISTFTSKEFGPFLAGYLADWQCTYWANKPTNMVKHVTCEGCHLVGFRLVSYSLQCGAPKIAKLVYKSKNYDLWYL